LTTLLPRQSTTFRLAMMLYIVLRYDSLVIRARWRRERKGVIDYPTLAELRYRIRKFLRVREVAARAAGVEPQQYLVLLQLKGLQGRRPPTIGVLAERLQIRHHSVVELVDRLARRGMVVRRRNTRDRRGVVVELRAKGQAILRRLALHSLAELETEGPALVSVLRRLIVSRAIHLEGGSGRLPAERLSDLDEVTASVPAGPRQQRPR
jgi:DNA-binding MarR family transcriptional regulator